MKTVLLNWHLNNTFGWGILGLNIFSHWANDPDLQPVMGGPIGYDDVKAVDPLRFGRVLDAIKRSNRLLAEITASGNNEFAGTLIDPLGNGLQPSQMTGKRQVGRCIFEDTLIDGARTRLSKYDVILCGSNWNAELLRQQFSGTVKVIWEGVDPSLFCPGPKSGVLDSNRFHVFSGGKIEFRKAQDLVLIAFREFSRKHDDAVLVTAWHSPWPALSVGFRGRLDAPVELNADGMLNIRKWCSDNGVDPDKVIDIGPIPNQLMPMVLREMDMVLQPSRAEACTNLPAKEAMACGLPVIVADNTGMKDLISDGNCMPLRSQRPIKATDGTGTEGWGESDVDEILACMEALYSDTVRRAELGHTAAAWIAANRTWRRHAAELKDFVLSLG